MHVLVVDAEPLVRWALTQMLSARGCTVTDASNAVEAMRLLSRPHPPFDVILLDHCLSDAHDLSLLKAAAALSPRSRIVMLTGCMTPDLAADAGHCGASAVLEKPVDLDAVAALVVARAGNG